MILFLQIIQIVKMEEEFEEVPGSSLKDEGSNSKSGPRKRKKFIRKVLCQKVVSTCGWAK